MSYEDQNEQSPVYKQFRTSLDIGMGVFYIIIGAIILFVKYFGTIELPATYAYILGNMMLLYGIFRIYRGIISIRRNKRNK
jgi:hypothetical protein